MGPNRIRNVTEQIKPNLRQIARENNHTDLTCMDKFKRNWKPILAGVALIAGGTLSIMTGLIAGGALTVSGLLGNIPGLIAGPAATYCLVGGGGAMIGTGLTLIVFCFFGGKSRSDGVGSDAMPRKEIRAAKDNSNISGPTLTKVSDKSTLAKYGIPVKDIAEESDRIGITDESNSNALP